VRSLVSFAYDSDEQRIRKTTPEEETLYFGKLYERVTHAASGATEHRYYVHSPERAVAVVARGGATRGTRYLHVDHLGSVDALTGEDGAVVERRSYDVFGQRRNPVWGQPALASLASGTALGFTGHEGDDLATRGGRRISPEPLGWGDLGHPSWSSYHRHAILGRGNETRHAIPGMKPFNWWG
jgi:hypothetical protein